MYICAHSVHHRREARGESGLRHRDKSERESGEEETELRRPKTSASSGALPLALRALEAGRWSVEGVGPRAARENVRQKTKALNTIIDKAKMKIEIGNKPARGPRRR